MGKATPNLVHGGFRGRDDDVILNSGTFTHDLNTDWNQFVDTDFRCRFLIQENAGGALNDYYKIQYNHDGGGWNDMTGSSPCQPAASGQYTDEDATSQVLGGGTFVAGIGVSNDYDCDTKISLSGNDETELEFCLTLDSGQVSASETMELRLRSLGTANYTDTYTPTITALTGSTEYHTATASLSLTGKDRVVTVERDSTATATMTAKDRIVSIGRDVSANPSLTAKNRFASISRTITANPSLSASILRSITKVSTATITLMRASTALKDPSAEGQIDSDWTKPTGAYTSNNIYSTSFGTIFLQNQDYYNYNFSSSDIPDGAEILGINFLVEAKVDVGNDFDLHLYCVKGGVKDGSYKTKSWVNTSDQYQTYGTGKTDKWGLSWLDTDIKSTNFGVWCQAVRNSGSGLIHVDHIGCIVHWQYNRLVSISRIVQPTISLTASRVASILRTITSTISLSATSIGQVVKMYIANAVVTLSSWKQISMSRLSQATVSLSATSIGQRVKLYTATAAITLTSWIARTIMAVRTATITATATVKNKLWREFPYQVEYPLDDDEKDIDADAIDDNKSIVDPTGTETEKDISL